MPKESKPPGQAMVIIWGFVCFVANLSFGETQTSGVDGNLGETLFTAF